MTGYERAIEELEARDRTAKEKEVDRARTEAVESLIADALKWREQERSGFRYVRVAEELIRLTSDWSKPLQVKISSEEGHLLELIFREVAP